MATGLPATDTPASHWQRVVAASKLTPQQSQQLQVIYAFFLRQKRALQVR